MKKIITLFFVLLTALSFSQAGRGTEVNNILDAQSKLTMGGGLWVTNNAKNTKIKGSPYLFENWTNKGLIYMTDNKAYSINQINYNIQLDRFEAKFSKDSVLAINPKEIEKIIVNNKIFKRFLDPEFNRNSYYEEMINTKDFVLLKRYQTEIVEGSFNPMTQQKVSSDELVKKEAFFAKKDDKLKNIKLKKSAVLKMLSPKKKEALKQYAKNQDLKFKNINDLKQMLEHFNTI